MPAPASVLGGERRDVWTRGEVLKPLSPGVKRKETPKTATGA